MLTAWIMKKVSEWVDLSFKKKSITVEFRCRAEVRPLKILDSIFNPASNPYVSGIDRHLLPIVTSRTIPGEAFNYSKYITLEEISQCSVPWLIFKEMAFIGEVNYNIDTIMIEYCIANAIPREQYSRIRNGVYTEYLIGQRIKEF